MIDNVTDPQVLNAIKTLLKKTTLDPVLREKLTSRALQSEKNIEEDKTFSRKDVEQKLQENFDL